MIEKLIKWVFPAYCQAIYDRERQAGWYFCEDTIYRRICTYQSKNKAALIKSLLEELTATAFCASL